MTSTLETQPAPSDAARARGPRGARGDHRVRLRRSRHGHRAAAARRDRLRRPRAGARRRRHLAGQHLSGRGLRRAVQPLLVLLRPEPRLGPLLLRAAGDPGLPAGRGRPVRRPRALRLRRRRQLRPLGRRRAALAGPHVGRRVPRPGARLRRRRPGRPDLSRHPRASTPSPARSCTPPAGTTRTTSPASGSPSSAPAPRPSRWCPRSSRSSTRVTVYQRTPAWVVPRTDHPVKPLLRRLYRFVPGMQKAIRGGPVPAARVPRHRHGQAARASSSRSASWRRRTCTARSATRSCARPSRRTTRSAASGS